MGDQSAIEWTEATWNPIRGCSRVSEGCRHCYAERQSIRLAWPHKYAAGDQTLKANQPGPYYGLVRSTPSGPRWTGKVVLAESALDLPLRWKKPRRIFVNSMSDLFHEKVPDEWIDRIAAVMVEASQHTFQVLTKRPERMLAYLAGRKHMINMVTNTPVEWPSKNIWWGVSVEDQATADARIPILLQTPVAVRWVSYEPALGPVDFERWLLPQSIRGLYAEPPLDLPEHQRLDWLVVGGESGPGARPFDIAWARQTIAQGRAAGVPVFVKQIGTRPLARGIAGKVGWPDHVSFEPDGDTYRAVLRDRKGGDPHEWPEDLRVREYPNGVAG